MKIAVCIKQVPGSTQVDVDPETGNLQRGSVDSKLNPYDLYALEASLRLKSQLSNVHITAFTMGPPQAMDILKEAYMMGVDDAVLISDRKFAGADVLATSFALCQALQAIGEFDLIVCGKQTTDGDTAQVGSELAELLDIPNLSAVTAIKVIDEKTLELSCDLPQENLIVQATFPLLIAVEKSVGEPRLPSYRLKQATANRPIKSLSLADFANRNEDNYGQAGSPTKVVKIFPPQHDNDHELWTGSNSELSNRLFTLLKERKFLQHLGE